VARTVMFQELLYIFHMSEGRLVRDKLVPADLQSSFGQIWALPVSWEELLGSSGGLTYKLNQGGRIDNRAALFIEWPKPFALSFIEAEEKRIGNMGFRRPVKLCPNLSGDERLDNLLLDKCYSGDKTWQQVLSM